MPSSRRLSTRVVLSALAALTLAGVAYAPPATAAAWTNVLKEGFESSFPPSDSKWSIRDYNGPSVGSAPNANGAVIWDDNATRGNGGSYWSAHPNDWTSYANFTHTYMKYGPLDLTGAIDAKVKFAYWLDSELNYDFFSYGYSCDGGRKWTETSLSGSLKRWKNGKMALASCVGSSTVYVRWGFVSDFDSPTNPAPTGVWVDDIKVQKLS